MDVMLDLETLGTKPGSVVLSIGAVAFKRATGEISTNKFYTVIDLQSSLSAGLVIDKPTWDWWLCQNDDARLVINESCSNKSVSLKKALTKFTSYLEKGSDGALSDIKLWGNGSDFDNVILTSCYEKLGLETPWKFWNNRCHRTFKNEALNLKVARSGIHHNALDDAIFQVKEHAAVYQHIYSK